MSQPKMSIVSVVFNDAEGLRRTIASMQRILDDVDYWVIDGSSDGGVRSVIQGLNDDRVQLVSEPDEGLYDAMNKGLDRVCGDWVLFLNAGDVLAPSFDPRRFLAGSDRAGRVVIGHTVERFAGDRYLRPKPGAEKTAFAAPPHPATVYPRCAFSELRFDTSGIIWADWLYTKCALDTVGGVFVSEVVSEFELGGRSTNYRDLGLVRKRLREDPSTRRRLKLLAKTVLFRFLPQDTFYRTLASRKYARVRGDALDLIKARGEVAASVEPLR